MDVSSRNDLRLGGIAELFERQQQLRFCIERCEVIYGKERRNGPGLSIGRKIFANALMSPLAEAASTLKELDRPYGVSLQV